MASKKARRVALIGVPMDIGGSKRGAAGGPAAIRRTDLLKHLKEIGCEARDLGDVEIPQQGKAKVGHSRKRYADIIRRVCEDLCETVAKSVGSGEVPVVLGGDHSLAMGSISGTAKRLKASGRRLGVLYLDAHGDMNVPHTTPSGNIHGMPVAHLLGMGDQRLARIGGFSPKLLPANTCLIGLRDLDADERALIKKSGVRAFTMKDVDRLGIGKVFDSALRHAADGTAGVHVSFDIDVVDPSVAQGTGTPSRGGLTYREAHYLMELVADSGKLLSMDMVEINPLEDVQNRTAELACELILSALGKTIL